MFQITHDLVLEVLEGTAEAALAEASALGETRRIGPTELTLRTSDLDAVRELRCVVAAYTTLSVPARRPRGLLETSVQQRLAALMADIQRQRPRPRFHGVRLSAAGADTPDMQRIADALAELAALPVDDDADLLVRVRRTPHSAQPPSWQVLIRTTARPLSTRAWRVADYPGALNATIAAAVLHRMEVGAEDSVLDMTCGSGTLLIEQLHLVAPSRAMGVDLSAAAIDAAERNQRAARRKGRIEWLVGDVLTRQIEPGFSRILTNPPWGTLHGDHEDNEQLLADLLARAAELAAPRAALGVLTHEITRMHRVIATGTGPWQLREEHRFFQKGHHPRLFRFEKR